MALTKPQGDMVMKLAAEQATTSGTAIDFTGIPAGTTMIVIRLDGVSTNGVGRLLVQLGDSGGIETSGYLSYEGYVAPSNVCSAAGRTDGFSIITDAAASVLHGQLVLTLQDATNNAWVASGNTSANTSPLVCSYAGTKATSAVLDRVRLTGVNLDTFDAGAISIAYF